MTNNSTAKKDITLNLLIKRLRVVRSGMCINDREGMLRLINELETLERAGYKMGEGSKLSCANCNHRIEWYFGQLYHYHQDIDYPETKRYVISRECYCGCKLPKD